MLTDICTHEALHEALRDISFHPMPTWAEREGWQEVMSETKAKWIQAAEKYLDFTWPILSMKYYLRFAETGENIGYLHAFWERRSALGILLIAECLEGKGRFLEQIVSGIFAICEETVWLTPFDLDKIPQRVPDSADHVVDLSCSETGALLAWADYLLAGELDKISPRIRQRIRKEIDIRLITPYLLHEDYWWMGFVKTPHVNNWNPWCNKNMLPCLLFSCEDEKRREDGVWKVMRSLDAYLRLYPEDGCCCEGPMYWGAAGGDLHACLHMLYLATGGKADIFDASIVIRIGQYFRNVHIDSRYFVNFADGDAIVPAATAAYGYGKSIGDKVLVQLGASAEATGPVINTWFSVYRHLMDILEERERRMADACPPYWGQSWMYMAQVMTARENPGSSKGFYLAAKGGNNGEPHNHNDVGNFILYFNGRPLFLDLGTEEYTAKTFSKDRFSLWYLQSQYHNCPVINGIDQQDGDTFAASQAECALTDESASLTLEISPAYPDAARAVKWKRSFCLDRRKRTLVISDSWQLRTEGCVAYHFMVACPPQEEKMGQIAFIYGEEKVYFKYSPDLLLTVEEIPLKESRLQANWGEKVYRFILAEPFPAQAVNRTFILSHEKGEKQ